MQNFRISAEHNVCASQITVFCSVGFLVLQRRVTGGELVEDGQSQWCNLERKFGVVKLEKTVSVHLQVA